MGAFWRVEAVKAAVCSGPGRSPSGLVRRAQAATPSRPAASIEGAREPRAKRLPSRARALIRLASARGPDRSTCWRGVRARVGSRSHQALSA
jgi:hypothetical protein